MKWIFASAVLLTLCVPVFAKGQALVYNLEAAKAATGKANHSFYIRTSSFLKQANAIKYETYIRHRTSYPVRIIHKNYYYVVLVGPISKPSEVRRTAKRLLSEARANNRVHYFPATHSPHAKWFVSVGGGVAFPSFGSNLLIQNNSGFPGIYSQDTYTTDQNNQGLFVLSLGRRWERDHKWLPSYALGLSYEHLFTTNMGNQITQYSSSVYTNYNYTWNTSADIFLAGIKLNLVNFRKLSPYVLGNLGWSINKSGHYTESALPGLTDTRVSAGFQTNTTTQLAYVVGAGIDLQTTKSLLFSAEYQYQNLGTMSLGNGLGAWSGQSLSLGNYHANAFLIRATYLIG